MPLKNSVGTQPASTATARYHASLHSSSLRSSFFFFPLLSSLLSPNYHCDSFQNERRNIAPSKLARPFKHLGDEDRFNNDHRTSRVSSYNR